MDEILPKLQTLPRPVILLEGRRRVSEADASRLKDLAQTLALEYPDARFRTGNAPGSDTLFAAGVARVDPVRLQYVVPYGAHRKKQRVTGAFVFPLDKLSPVQEGRVASLTITASPENRRIIENRHKIPALGKKALYLLRDTLKVTGCPPHLPKADAAFFYADPEDPMKGGTGHTIRVCRSCGVPVVLQGYWGRS